MKKLSVTFSFILIVKQSSAIRNTGLNNELLVIYVILIGICATIILVRNGFVWLKNRKNPVKNNQEVSEER